MAGKVSKNRHLSNNPNKAEVFKLIEKERDHVFNLISDIIIVADAKTGMLVDANLAAQKFLGKTLSQIRKMHQSQLHNRADRAKYRESFRQIVKTGGVQEDVYILNKNREPVPTDVSAGFIKTGGRDYIQGVFRDVSRRKKIEEELIGQKIKFETIFDLSPNFIIYKSQDDKFLEVNKAFVDFIGLPKEKIIGQSTFDMILDQEVAQKTRQDDLEVMKTGRPKFGVIRKFTSPFSQKSIWGMYSKEAFLDADGKVIGILSVTADITKMVESEKEIELQKDLAFERSEKLQAILENIGDFVFVIDHNYKITMVNKSACQLVGCSYNQAIGKYYGDFFKFVYEKNQQVNDQFIKNALEKGVVASVANHTVLITKDNKAMPVDFVASPIKDENGQITGAVVVFRDITRERNIDRMKTEFVSIASHQLRTPLTGIKWFLELLLDQKIGALNEKQLDFLNQVAQSNERMISLVSDLLSVSRIETGGKKFEIVKRNINIIPVIKSIIMDNIVLTKEKNIKITGCIYKLSKIMIFADPEHIRQAFQNLITNAIKYSNNNGVIEINCQYKNKEIIFFIKDKGVGIPPDQQKRVFEKFFRADNIITKETSGTGLGLYIAKAIIDGHGGRIWFKSKEGKGTTFYFSIPKK
ncbi:MAG: PAS domain S-box protein [Candidatus Buchananbacteria bacterium]|nr:PAS domain S-box protein [Candidatus Buchananbacteria bacterium]